MDGEATWSGGAGPAHAGASAVTLSVGAPANHFPTPSVGAGLLLAAAADQVVALR